MLGIAEPPSACTAVLPSRAERSGRVGSGRERKGEEGQGWEERKRKTWSHIRTHMALSFLGGKEIGRPRRDGRIPRLRGGAPVGDGTLGEQDSHRCCGIGGAVDVALRASIALWFERLVGNVSIFVS